MYINKIKRKKEVVALLAELKTAVAETVEQAVAIQQIPAPTFDEGERGMWVADRWRELGLLDIDIDALGNVYGRLGGGGGEGVLVVSAHLDTVFPAGTDLTVVREEGKVRGPGIGDNSLGVAGLMYLAGVWGERPLSTAADIWLVANIGEEGLGDLKGMRAVVDHFGDEAKYIVVEGGTLGHIFHGGIGVKRFAIEVTAPGGHSWGNFGSASAVHVLGKLIAAICDLEVPSTPRTTFNVGVIEGGTTINTIAQKAKMQLDLRSESPEALLSLVERVEALVTRFRQPGVTIEMEVIGDRPAGQVPAETPLVVWAEEALLAMGYDFVTYAQGSTDANIPLSRGCTAVCIGLTKAHHTHRLEEYIDIEPLSVGLGQLLLLTLAGAGYGSVGDA
ncbi:MAG TPA: M20/M25/M40 family metallo-hydrolase [Anaerolineae bacterium]|nr:M20/M25/M40 family metallo-hydrolase [Anaerolineae bacterium]